MMRHEGSARHLTCFGVSHPLSRAFADHLQPIVTDLADPAAVHVDLRSDVLPWRGGPDQRAFYLKLDGLDGLKLGARWSASAAANFDRFEDDCRCLERAHRTLPILSLDAALRSPGAIAAFLADLFGVPLLQAAVVAAERGHPALRRACLPFLHPMAFLEAIGPLQATPSSVPPIAAPDPAERLAAYRTLHAPGSALVITSGHDVAFEDIAAAGEDAFQIITLPPRDALEELDRRDAMAFDLIWFDRIDGGGDLESLLPWARQRLTPSGTLAGAEHSPTSAIRTLARLTTSDGALYGHIDGGQWSLTLPSPERA